MRGSVYCGFNQQLDRRGVKGLVAVSVDLTVSRFQSAGVDLTGPQLVFHTSVCEAGRGEDSGSWLGKASV